ncbi:MAG: glycosyltransferase family 4 protein [Chloroflexi bacterium]|nr:glycosyltransferase family 4 protein [Chloroflexota bacterium]
MMLASDLRVGMRTPEQSVSPPLTRPARDGINLSGYLRDESGWGAAGRGYAKALQHLGMPLALNDFSALTNNRSEERAGFDLQHSNPYDINLVCVDPSQHFAFLSEAGTAYFKGHYNIGGWAWELPRFPANWFNRFGFYDEIWVTTSFVANALAPVAPVPVVRIPPVLVPARLGSRDRGRALIRAHPDEFIFLFIFDFHSHMERKNPLAVVDAFRCAFSPQDSVRLVVKCVNGASDPQGFGELRERARGSTISVFEGYWSGEAVRDLAAGCDAFVSLHRSEGTGLTISDAMALGKPVIATGWSGNMDFMNIGNSFPVKYELVEIENGVGPYREGEIWAEPSVEHAAQLMRHVFENREDAAKRGEAARRDILAYFSAASIAARIQERLKAVAVHRDLAAFRHATWSAFLNYENLATQIRDTVRRVLPQKSTVAVVSKGDDRLLQLDKRRAWHFPQTLAGDYAGYHPADSAAAIRHLEELRSRGARYLLFPASAFWWLDHYAGFKRHLEGAYRCVWRGKDCIIYCLDRAETRGRNRIPLARPAAPSDSRTNRPARLTL